jgi:hypothetical protein
VQPLLQRKNNKYYIFRLCVCSRRYPACNAHAPYCHLWPVQLYKLFSYYLIKGTIFGKRSLNVKCVLIFSPTVSETFLILRRIERDMIKKSILVFMYSTGYCCHIAMKLECSGQIFEKY